MNYLYLVLAGIIVLLNAFFVATEFALVRVRETRINSLVESGVRRAEAVHDVLHNLNDYLSACQLGVTITSLGLGWVGEAAFAALFEPLFVGVGRGASLATHSAALVAAFITLTVLHVVFGELTPKTVALQRAEQVALLFAWPIRVFRTAFFPLIWVLNRAAIATARLLGVTPPPEASLAHSEEELRIILAMSERSGVLSDRHARLLTNALDFADRTVRQIMVPRADIVSLDVRRGWEENLAAARDGGHTRYPLCDGELDRVVGVLHIKDLFHVAPSLAAPPDLKALAREPMVVPETLRLEQVLALFQGRRLHLALVIDEYGGTSGLVTLEDVLEELTGEIQDEFDEEPAKVQTLPGGRLSVDAGLSLHEVEDLLDLDREDVADVDTLGGLVLARLGRIARVGDLVDLAGRRVEVARIRGRRIVRLTVHPPSDRETEPGAGATSRRQEKRS